jgi:hypothetical protein
MAARWHVFVLLAGWGTAMGSAAAWADGDLARAPVPAPRPLAPRAELADWIKLLSSNSYAARKEATQRLIAAGTAAIAPVTAAAESDDLELPARCIAILKRLSDVEDHATKQAAQSALRELTGSSRAYLARKADEALRPPVPPASIPLGGGRAGPFGRAVRLQPPRGVPLARPVPLQPERTLVRELIVDDNGRKVHLRYENRSEKGSTFLVRVIEPLAGRDRVTEYKAESVTELREKHPDAHALYAKHSRKLYAQPLRTVVNHRVAAPAAGIPLGNARIQVQVVPLRPAEPAPEARPPRAADGREEALRRFLEARRQRDRRGDETRELLRRQFEQQRRAAELQKQLLETSARLRTLAEQGDIQPDDLRRLADELQRVSTSRRPDEIEAAVPAPRPPARPTAPPDHHIGRDRQ